MADAGRDMKCSAEPTETVSNGFNLKSSAKPAEVGPNDMKSTAKQASSMFSDISSGEIDVSLQPETSKPQNNQG